MNRVQFSGKFDYKNPTSSADAADADSFEARRGRFRKRLNDLMIHMIKNPNDSFSTVRDSATGETGFEIHSNGDYKKSDRGFY